MAHIVGGGDQTFAALAFGMPHPRTVAALESQFQNLSTQISAAGQEFMDRQRAMFEQFNGSDALRLAKAALRAVTHAFTPNIVQPLLTMGALQQAPPAMQLWIMANPYIREQYHRQRCDGYSDSYIDSEPGNIGKTHSDWRDAVHGILRELPDGEDGEGDWVISIHSDDDEGRVKLTFADRDDIQMTWQVAEALVRLGPGAEDPTSIYASKL